MLAYQGFHCVLIKSDESLFEFFSGKIALYINKQDFYVFSLVLKFLCFDRYASPPSIWDNGVEQEVVQHLLLAFNVMVGYVHCLPFLNSKAIEHVVINSFEGGPDVE